MTQPLSNTQAPAENFPSKNLATSASSGDPETGTVTRISMEAAEPSSARANTFLKNPNHTCCIGVDVPGVGHTHASNCPTM